MNQLTTTLVFLVQDGSILLARKKRGFGMGKWNGIGGKVDPGETVQQGMIRECQEEICATPKQYQQVAIHTFYVTYSGEPHTLRMHTFLCTDWEGEPIETEEMAPEWFDLEAIPYDEMWEDDKFWLPDVLNGKRLLGEFEFDETDHMLSHKITEAESLDDA